MICGPLIQWEREVRVGKRGVDGVPVMGLYKSPVKGVGRIRSGNGFVIFACGIWVYDIEGGATCGRGASASRARAFAKQRFCDIRKVWSAAEIIIESDGEAPLLDVERFARIYGRLHLAADSHHNGDMGKGGPLPPRYGRYLRMRGDYASYETFPLVAALSHFSLRPSEDPWAPTQKIRQGRDDGASLLQSIRRDIRMRRKTATDAYRGELGPTPARQIEDRDIEDTAPLLVRRIFVRTLGIRFDSFIRVLRISAVGGSRCREGYIGNNPHFLRGPPGHIAGRGRL